jgi:hypothetical protein
MFVTYVWKLHEHLKSYIRIVIMSVKPKKLAYNRIVTILCKKKIKHTIGHKKCSRAPYLAVFWVAGSRAGGLKIGPLLFMAYK